MMRLLRQLLHLPRQPFLLQQQLSQPLAARNQERIRKSRFLSGYELAHPSIALTFSAAILMFALW